MKFKSIAIVLLALVFSKNVFAVNLIEEHSPIKWYLDLNNNKKTKKFAGEQINDFIEKGIENKKLGIKCTFKLDKEFGDMLDPYSNSKKKIKIYTEKIWTECMLKDGINVTTKAAVCISGHGQGIVIDFSYLYFDHESFGVNFTCNNIP